MKYWWIHINSNSKLCAIIKLSFISRSSLGCLTHFCSFISYYSNNILEMYNPGFVANLSTTSVNRISNNFNPLNNWIWLKGYMAVMCNVIWLLYIMYRNKLVRNSVTIKLLYELNLSGHWETDLITARIDLFTIYWRNTSVVEDKCLKSFCFSWEIYAENCCFCFNCPNTNLIGYTYSVSEIGRESIGNLKTIRDRNIVEWGKF